jgi:hypothetical protein
MALRAITCGGLQIYALNACESPDEFRSLWSVLDALNAMEKPASREDLLAEEIPIWIAEPNVEETLTRHRVSDAKFQLLRMATAARERFLQGGGFPETREAFAPFLPKGLPQDPFTSFPLRFAASADSFLCYSFGPDERNQLGAVTYDATNGTLSAGDVVLEVPRQRKYPFPQGGVKAATGDELLRQFPNGLPTDPFADTRGRSLRVTQTTPVMVFNVGPDRVFSVGPDTDEKSIDAAGPSYRPSVLYDPTNGITSRGDLFLEVLR